MRRDVFPRAMFAACAAALISGCGGGSNPSAPVTNGGNNGGSTNRVTVGTTAFAPTSITVPVNSAVTWNWDSCSGDPYYGQTCVSHSVTFDDASISGSDVQSAGSFSKTFASKGVYTYHCSVHGKSMAGTVTVQ